MSPANRIRGILGRVRFDEVLRTFAEFFEREGIRWAVIGGLADGVYGNPRHDMQPIFAVDERTRDHVVAFANAAAPDVPIAIVFVRRDSPLLRDLQEHAVARVPLRIAAPSMWRRIREGPRVDVGPPAFTFEKYLEALTQLSVDRPASREVSGPVEPFTL